MVLSLILCIIKTTINFILKYTGRTDKSYGDRYEESAHLLKIWMRSKIHDVFISSKDDFLVSHESCTHPRYALKENVSLYCLTPTEAVFVETPESMNIFDCKRNAFLVDAQYTHAYRLITMPIASFHQLANEIGEPKAPVILLSQPGRCGSTLLMRIAETIPGTVCMGEPEALTSILLLRISKIFTDKDVETLVKSCIYFYCKERSKVTKLFLIKSRGTCVQLVRHIAKSVPSVHHLYLYRESLRNIQSFERALDSTAFRRWMKKLGKQPLIGQFIPSMWTYLPGILFISASEGPYEWTRKADYVNALSPLGLWCLRWALDTKTYLDVRESGINIAAIKFEEFMANIHAGWDAVLAHCNLSSAFKLTSEADKTLATDSHKGARFSEESLKHRKYIPLTSDIIPELDAIMDRFGLPRVGETCVLYGTIGLTE